MRKRVMTIFLLSVLFLLPLLWAGCSDDDPDITLDSCRLNETCQLQ